MHRELRIGRAKKKICRSFLVKWLGYGDEHSRWEPEANLNAACLLGGRKQTEGSGTARTGVVVAPEHNGTSAGSQQQVAGLCLSQG